MEAVTQQEYCAAMEGMFASSGWRKFWKPKLEELRQLAIDTMLYSQFLRIEEVYGAQKEVMALDTLLAIEESIRQLRQHITQNPDEGAHVLQYPAKDLELEKLIGPIVSQ